MPDGDRREQGGGRRVAEQARRAHHVDEERRGRDRDHPGREAVQAVDQVHGVHDERTTHRIVSSTARSEPSDDDARSREPEVQRAARPAGPARPPMKTWPVSFVSADDAALVVDRPSPTISVQVTSAASGSGLPSFMSEKNGRNRETTAGPPGTPRTSRARPSWAWPSGGPCGRSGWSIAPDAHDQAAHERRRRRTSSPRTRGRRAGRRSRWAQCAGPAATRQPGPPRSAFTGRRGTAASGRAPAGAPSP